MSQLHPTLARVTDAIIERSRITRSEYLTRLAAQKSRAPRRGGQSCSNFAHAFAACADHEKTLMTGTDAPNIAIISAYNDMLSAHQPFAAFPAIIKEAVHEAGGMAQFAGGVPAMCDGVTQGQAGMELSLFSRDVIALATAVALSHDMFEGAIMLGVCDKIVPGLVIAALSFGYLPTIFAPAGPMPSGLPNREKARVRQLYAEGKVGRAELLKAESESYHAPGTCTFYGTANSNQMLMEFMGLHLPGASFINPGTPLRDALTRAAAHQVLAVSAAGNDPRPIGDVIDERSFVNAIVGLLATGGSTNHTIHLIAMAAAAGIKLAWEDFDALSAATPLLARIYPNGEADVNHFQAAGGLSFVMRELIGAGLLHADARTVADTGEGLRAYLREPKLLNGKLVWQEGTHTTLDESILRPASNPFSPDGGLRMVNGNLGTGIVKLSAVKPQHRIVEAPARVFFDQAAMQEAFKAGELHRDVVVVVLHQGPRSNGMPELHKLTPPLGVLQDLGYKVALVTDGRMSGASGKVPAAIHISPECAAGGPLAKVRDGDIIRLDCETGKLHALVSDEIWATRAHLTADRSSDHWGIGRELFAPLRALVNGADLGASIFSVRD